MSAKKLGLALDLLQPDHAGKFEEFAAAFITAEFPNLRVTASQSGDKGRDAELWESEEDSAVKLQFSLERDWRGKIRRTARTLRRNYSATKVLIYVTNLPIGSKADDLRTELRRDYKVSLDVRDRSYFVTRWGHPAQHQVASRELIDAVVEPFLAERTGDGDAQPLTESEAQAALVYLVMQRQDDSREKGLTKLAFEALVRAALRDTSPERKMSRRQIYSLVSQSISSHDTEMIERFTDSALDRMDKKYVRRYRSDDAFCLTREERGRIAERLVDLEIEQIETDREIRSAVEQALERLGAANLARADALQPAARALVEHFLYRRGEAFAAAVVEGSVHELELGSIDDVAENLAAGSQSWKDVRGDEIAVVVSAARHLLVEPPAAVRWHFHVLADAYALHAFLRETPDVQSAVAKMFSDGELWVDANVILRLFAETLEDEETPQAYRQILDAARKSGLVLRTTEGVIEEVEAHTHLSTLYARRRPGDAPWRGRIPFLFRAFSLTEQSAGEFPNWIEQFRGDRRPFDDIIEYISVEYGIDIGDLEEDAAKAPTDVRGEVQEFWHGVHERRGTGRKGDVDAAHRAQMVAHDVEMYLGVVYRRRRKRASPFGYSTWWLTLDSAAYDVARQTTIGRREPGRFTPPTISPDFLTTFLSVGPARQKLTTGGANALPLLLDLGQLDLVSDEFLKTAQQVRSDLRNLPKNTIRRRVRDELDRARVRVGPRAREGLDEILNRLSKGKP